MLTKELFASLQHDGINIDKDTITKALNADGEALLAIGFEYDSREDYAKAMAWYRLSANQNNANAQNSIAILYYEGNGVPQDVDIALEYYLKAAANSDRYAMANIGYRFCDGQGVPVDHYKALEWFVHSGKAPDNITELNERGVYLKPQVQKTLYQLITETEGIIRNNTRAELTKLQHLHKIEISNLHKEIQNKSDLFEKTRTENQILENSNSSLEQQLTYQTEAIQSMNTASESFRGIIKSKNNEIELLRKENQRFATIETEMGELRRTLEEYHSQIKVLVTSDAPSVHVKTESDDKGNQSILCESGNKKRKLSSNDT